jgi:hypothetical protein
LETASNPVKWTKDPSMSNVEPHLQSGTNRKLVYIACGAVLVLVIPLAVWMLGGTGGTTDTSRPGGEVEENSLISAREALAKNTDLNTCRSAVLQINSYLANHSDQRSPGLTAGQKKLFQETFGLDAREMDEVEAGNYTVLDAHHLELCYLLRDAARSLEVKTPGGSRGAQQTPLDLATAAFGWVTREVRLDERPTPGTLPPTYTLQRGWGSGLERALVFLTLLTQFGAYDGKPTDLTGCLLMVRDKPGDAPRPWACGVLAGKDNDLYLFDPHLGLPLPGPDGKGVATLAAVCKDPALLAQLTTGEHRYDVTAEQAKEAEARVVLPLSALSPRMRHLQEKLLPQARVRPAVDAGAEIERLKSAVGAGGDKPGTVTAWKEASTLLRNFLSEDEGGVDKGVSVPLRALAGFTTPDDPLVGHFPKKQLFEFQLTPWVALPDQLRDPTKFSYNVGLGSRVRDRFQTPFVASATQPGGIRDSMIRGRYESAINKLTDEREFWHKALVARESVPDLDKQVEAWLAKATPVYAEQLRARPTAPRQAIESSPEIQALWKGETARPLIVLIDGAIAGPRLAEVLYLLGLCKQDQAEQIQARLDLQARTAGAAPDASDVQKAKETWKNAVNWWKKYQEDYPKGAQAVAVRRMLGRARAMLGDVPGAVAQWEDLAEPMTEQEKVAVLYLARQVQKK